ncbi:MAG: PDDEXK nuclease domain-containing protein [Metallibacterium sp.]
MRRNCPRRCLTWRESLKDPYRMDFLGLGKEAQERAVESALVQYITQFLLEPGAGFACVGRQVHIEVGGEDFCIDLLFYHLKLRCHVVVEPKAGAFKSEHTGHEFLPEHGGCAGEARGRQPDHRPAAVQKPESRGGRIRALRDINQPIGVAEYQLINALPAQLKTSLPSIEQIELELGGEQGSA